MLGFSLSESPQLRTVFKLRSVYIQYLIILCIHLVCMRNSNIIPLWKFIRRFRFNWWCHNAFSAFSELHWHYTNFVGTQWDAECNHDFTSSSGILIALTRCTCNTITGNCLISSSYTSWYTQLTEVNKDKFTTSSRNRIHTAICNCNTIKFLIYHSHIARYTSITSGKTGKLGLKTYFWGITGT